jgi:hypothetical protein
LEPSARAGDVIETKPAADSGLNEAQRNARVILAGIRANSERQEGLELTLSHVLKDRRAQEAATTTTRLPGGGEIVVTHVPSSESVERAVTLDDRLRLDRGGNGTTPLVTYVYDGQRWLEADSTLRRVAKRWPHQMGGVQLDPREAAGVDLRTTLAEVLAESRLQDAKMSREGTLIRIETATTAGQPITLDFDPEKSFLPVRSLLFHVNGKIVRDAQLSYAFVSARGAWVLEGISTRVYDDSVDGLADPDAWKQQIRTTVQHRILDRSTAEAELASAIPTDYRVIDFTDESTMTRPREKQAAVASDWQIRWFIAGHVALLAVLAVAYWWRRRAASALKFS